MVQDWKKSWSNDTTVKKEMQVGYFVIDEFAVLRIALDKKEFAEINDSLRRIILMGRAANTIGPGGVTTSGNMHRWSD